MDKMQVINNKRARGHILKTLQWSHPTPTSLEALQSAVVSSLIVSSPDIKEYIDYLEDRKYITVKNVDGVYGLNLTYIKLTSVGVDLLEGTLHDEGVLL